MWKKKNRHTKNLQYILITKKQQHFFARHTKNLQYILITKKQQHFFA
jgi:hypothetical protein